MTMFKKVFIKAIGYYQSKWSQRFGGNCVFEPSCSYYGIQALEKYGVLRGSLKTIKRILRCKPPNSGYEPMGK